VEKLESKVRDLKNLYWDLSADSRSDESLEEFRLEVTYDYLDQQNPQELQDLFCSTALEPLPPEELISMGLHEYNPNSQADIWLVRNILDRIGWGVLLK